MRIKQGDEWKAAFVTNRGLFEPTVMFFGLTNSPATFQTMMNALFAEELRERWLTVYMDDMLIHTTDDLTFHRRCVNRILAKLQEHDLFLKPEKCQFEQRKVEFLGVVLEAGTVQMDPTKVQGVADWSPPKTVKDVRAFLGFTGFYRYFIKDYSRIARPLIDLTRKATPFHWEERQFKAFETLKTLMCSHPVLTQPDYDKPFFLATDASAYGVGAVLSQEGETNIRTQKPTMQPIAYYSATFTPTERNYDIYERELLAILKALQHWRPHLAATETPVTVLTDHANLTFWKNPKKVNRRVARWFATLQDYNLTIKHVPGKLHSAPDLLSRPPGADKGEDDNTDLTLLPKELFVRLSTAEPKEHDWDGLVAQSQAGQPKLIASWRRAGLISPIRGRYGEWHHQGRAAVPNDEGLKRRILKAYHDDPTSGHPGRDWTTYNVSQAFWWPGMNLWIANYVKGCATCQQSKNLTHRKKVPRYAIPANPSPLPFKTVAMDLITQLPKSKGHDAILTIVDQGNSRAALFLPCSTTITGEEVANLYLQHVYPWFGLPERMISDRDPRFTSHFAKALCRRLGIQQNLSTAFHPQTDGLSERANQWIEQYLRLIASPQQDDWAEWLPIATATHNHFPNATTKVPPSKALMGYLPKLSNERSPPSTNPKTEERLEQARQHRARAQAAINEAAKAPPSDQYQVGAKVWLEAKNLALPYQTPKLAPKRHGPFTITKQVSPVAYQLALPPAWTIHDVFHASLLTPYHETIEHGTNFTRPPPDIVEGEMEFEVEQIRGHRYFGRARRLQYLVKWKGYPEADNTWEPADQVFAPKLIDQYHRANPLSGAQETSLKTQAKDKDSPVDPQ